MDKKTSLIILTAATLACMLFLPFVAFGRMSVSLMDLISEVGFNAFFDTIWSAFLFIALIGAVVALIMAIIGNNAGVAGGASAGVAGLVVFIIGLFVETMGKGAEFGQVFEAIFQVIGIGFWLALAGFIITSVVAKKN